MPNENLNLNYIIGNSRSINFRHENAAERRGAQETAEGFLNREANFPGRVDDGHNGHEAEQTAAILHETQGGNHLRGDPPEGERHRLGHIRLQRRDQNSRDLRLEHRDQKHPVAYQRFPREGDFDDGIFSGRKLVAHRW